MLKVWMRQKMRVSLAQSTDWERTGNRDAKIRIGGEPWVYLFRWGIESEAWSDSQLGCISPERPWIVNMIPPGLLNNRPPTNSGCVEGLAFFSTDKHL